MNKLNRYLPKYEDYVILVFWLLILYMVYLKSPTTFSGVSKSLTDISLRTKKGAEG